MAMCCFPNPFECFTFFVLLITCTLTIANFGMIIYLVDAQDDDDSFLDKVQEIIEEHVGK